MPLFTFQIVAGDQALTVPVSSEFIDLADVIDQSSAMTAAIVASGICVSRYPVSIVIQDEAGARLRVIDIDQELSETGTSAREHRDCAKQLIRQLQ